MSGHPLGTVHPVRTRDGRSLHAMTRGESPPGTPVVIFEGGLAAPRSYWGLVVPQVAEFARAVVYDRAGLGQSKPDSLPRTMARMADDLGSLLDTLGPGPFILVGHSAGGLIVRFAAADRRERIAGLLLVDPSDEGCDTVFKPWFRLFERVAQHASSLLARLGLLERLYRGQFKQLPPALQAEFSAEAFTPAAMETRGAELAGFVTAMNALRSAPAVPVDYPLTVISGGLADAGMSAALRAEANAAHARRAQLSRAGRHVIAERSGHFVPLTEPDVVAAEIRAMVDAAVSESAEAFRPA
ncbi:alpha/beta fold hydrolase [Sphingobium yanoikuyae]|uniref:alpha/beta fold hydrolase n=1 Tax=Sphingobium yanoikuyae TaxID=13690 RepID=UPI0035AECCB8